MAYLTFVIVTLFFVLHMPRILCAAYEVSNTWKIVRCVNGKVQYMPEMTFYRWDQVSFLLMVISSSMNFLIYCTGSDQFKVMQSLISEFRAVGRSKNPGGGSNDVVGTIYPKWNRLKYGVGGRSSPPTSFAPPLGSYTPGDNIGFRQTSLLTRSTNYLLILHMVRNRLIY